MYCRTALARIAADPALRSREFAALHLSRWASHYPVLYTVHTYCSLDTAGQPPHPALLAPDCFHVGRRLQARAAANIWNNLLQVDPSCAGMNQHLVVTGGGPAECLLPVPPAPRLPRPQSTLQPRPHHTQPDSLASQKKSSNFDHEVLWKRLCQFVFTSFAPRVHQKLSAQ